MPHPELEAVISQLDDFSGGLTAHNEAVKKWIDDALSEMDKLRSRVKEQPVDEPALEIPDDQAQVVIDDLWAKGYRPTVEVKET
jgi:NADH/NAD ratio-sensing transcriptional regulator Rex